MYWMYFERWFHFLKIIPLKKLSIYYTTYAHKVSIKIKKYIRYQYTLWLEQTWDTLPYKMICLIKHSKRIKKKCTCCFQRKVRKIEKFVWTQYMANVRNQYIYHHLFKTKRSRIKKLEIIIIIAPLSKFSCPYTSSTIYPHIHLYTPAPLSHFPFLHTRSSREMPTALIRGINKRALL